MTHQEDEAVQQQRVEERHSSGRLIGQDHTTLKQTPDISTAGEVTEHQILNCHLQLSVF